MQLSVRRTDPTTVECDALVVPLLKTERVPPSLRTVDTATEGLIGSYLKSGDLTGKEGEVQSLPTAGVAAGRLIFVGLGSGRELDPERLRRAGGRALGALGRAKAKRAAVLVPSLRRMGADAVG